MLTQFLVESRGLKFFYFQEIFFYEVLSWKWPKVSFFSTKNIGGQGGVYLVEAMHTLNKSARNSFFLLQILLAPCVSWHSTSKTSGWQNCVIRLQWRCDDIFIEIISQTQNRVMNTIVTVRSPQDVKCLQQRVFTLLN